ncbi:MAG: hypothetical protein ABJ308_16555 [Halieaceae bacterium]
MTVLVATSVVRGTRQGESHGGVYLVDFDKETVARTIDWNTGDIDWQGRGWDRGLRGIALDGERVYIAASDELFVYNPQFKLLNSYRNPFLKHCHEIHVHERRLYLTSTAYDAILGFDLDAQKFCWGMHISRLGDGYKGNPFNPESNRGPVPANDLHLNSVFCTDQGMFISGLQTGAVLVYNGRRIQPWVDLPTGSHNARPHRDGVLYNDTRSDRVCFQTREREVKIPVKTYPEGELTHTDLDDSRIARQGFGRGLCSIDDSLIAAGSSPSTISLHDLDAGKRIKSVTLSQDIRNAIHGLEVWPY